MTHDMDTSVSLLSGILGESFDTFTPEVTSALFQKLLADGIFEQLSTLQVLMSSFDKLPSHPWDRLKYELYGEEWEKYTPIALSSIKVPENYDVQECATKLINVSKECSNHIIDNVLSGQNASQIDFSAIHKTHFTTLSTIADNTQQRVYSTDKHCKYVDFIEMVMNIQHDGVTDYEDAAKKVIHQFTDIFRD